MGRHDVLLHWKCKSHDVLLHWKCKSRFLDIVIDNHRGRGHDLWFQFFKKVRSFTPFHRMSGIRSVSGIWPTCQGWCPPLDYDQFKILQQHAERTLTRSVGDYNQFKILQQHTERTLTRSVGDYNQFKILQQHAERTLTRSVGDYNQFKILQQHAAGLEKTRVFLKKPSPVGFFCFFLGFLGFVGFFVFFVFFGVFLPGQEGF